MAEPGMAAAATGAMRADGFAAAPDALGRLALDQALFCLVPAALAGLVLAAVNLATPRSPAWKRVWSLWFAVASLPLPLLVAGKNAPRLLDSARDSLHGMALSAIPPYASLALFALHAAGAAILLCVLASRHLASRWIATQAKETSRPAEDADVALFSIRADGMGLDPLPRLCMSELSPGPAASGIVRPLVIFPQSLAKSLGREGFSRVVSHELAHHRGDDLLLALLADIALALNWMNPVAWFARSRLAAACELDADRRALALQGDGDWGAYAETIIDVLRWKQARPAMPGASGLARDARETKNRIVALERAAVKRLAGKRNGKRARGNAGSSRSFLVPRWPGRIFAGALVALSALCFTVAAARYSRIPATASVAGGDRVDDAGRTGADALPVPGDSSARTGGDTDPGRTIWTAATKLPLSGAALVGTPAFVTALDAAIDTMDWERARELARIQFDRYPGYEAASILMARIEMKDGNFRAVRDCLYDVKSPSLTALNLIARSFDYENRREEALRWYGFALEAQWLADIHEAERNVIETGLERPLRWRKAEPLPVDSAVSRGETEVTDRSGWSASSIPDSGRARPELAIDGNPHTRFGNYIRMKPGMCLAVNFGRTIEISRVWLVDDAGGDTIFPFDYPRFWRLEVLVGGEGWREVARGKGVPDRYAGAGFDPLACDGIRFFQDGSTGGECWSVYEVMVAGPSNGGTGPAR